MRGKDPDAARSQPPPEALEEVAPPRGVQMRQQRANPNEIKAARLGLVLDRRLTSIDRDRIELRGAEIHAVTLQVTCGDSSSRGSRLQMPEHATMSTGEVRYLRHLATGFPGGVKSLLDAGQA
jgi:hypothetical protein